MCIRDSDYNAVDLDELERTHKPFYEIVRKAHPDMPVIMITRPDTDHLPDDAAARRGIILRTYHSALERGENVYFIDGATLFGSEGREYCTVDGSHPNDMGFYRMAQTIYPVLKKALGV